MNPRNLVLPGVQAPQPTTINLMNDVQLVAWLAAQLYGSNNVVDAADAVAVALDIVAEAAVRVVDLGHLVRQKQRQYEATRDAFREAPEG